MIGLMIPLKTILSNPVITLLTFSLNLFNNVSMARLSSLFMVLLTDSILRGLPCYFNAFLQLLDIARYLGCGRSPLW
jgi:hypothetical protein